MVAIFELARDVDWWTWLCPRHLAEWEARGWQIRERKEAPHALTCDERNSGTPCGAVEASRAAA